MEKESNKLSPYNIENNIYTRWNDYVLTNIIVMYLTEANPSEEGLNSPPASTLYVFVVFCIKNSINFWVFNGASYHCVSHLQFQKQKYNNINSLVRRKNKSSNRNKIENKNLIFVARKTFTSLDERYCRCLWTPVRQNFPLPRKRDGKI